MACARLEPIRLDQVLAPSFKVYTSLNNAALIYIGPMIMEIINSFIAKSKILVLLNCRVRRIYNAANLESEGALGILSGANLQLKEKREMLSRK